MSGEKYKVLIADDEYWSREKLVRMIAWEEYGLELLAPAENGEEVLKRAESEKVDILITDINMPYVDGVELVQRIREKYPEVLIFVVSGYDDFEYVKSTMKMGAINYLLKPVAKMELIQAVSEALDRLYEKKQAEQIEKENDRKLMLASSWLQDREFSCLIDNAEKIYSGGFSLEMNLDITGYTLMLIKIHDLQKIPDGFYKDMQGFSYSMKKKIMENLGDLVVRIFNHVSRPNEFLVISDQENAAIYKGAVSCIKMLEKTLDSPISIVLSDHSYTMESIYSAYVQDVSQLMLRSYDRESRILVYNKDEEYRQKEHIDYVFDEKAENDLISLLEHNSQKQIKKFVLHILGGTYGETKTYLEVKQTLRQVNNILLRFYGKEVESRDIVDMESTNDYVEQAVEKMNLELLCELEEDFLDTLLQMRNIESMESMQAVAKQIREYIEMNYAKELTLTGLAQKYNIEKTYLSRLFKQETGKNLMPYIAEKRIDHAKELIKQGDISLTEVSYLVGYDDYSYFNKVFRKIMGISPSEYRQNMLEGINAHK